MSSDAPVCDPGCGDLFVLVLLLAFLDFLILPCSHMLITVELVFRPSIEVLSLQVAHQSEIYETPDFLLAI